MNHLINSAKDFANSLRTYSEANFKNHHRKRLASKRFDCNATTQTEFTIHLFYRIEFKIILTIIVLDSRYPIKLTNDNLKSFILLFNHYFYYYLFLSSSQPFKYLLNLIFHWIIQKNLFFHSHQAV